MMRLWKWFRAKPQPIRYRGIGMSLIAGNTLVKTAEDADMVIGMMRGTVPIPK